MQSVEINVTVKLDLSPIIQPGSLQRSVVHLKAGHAHDMQWRKRCGTQAGDIAGVWRDLRFIQRDMKHYRLVLSILYAAKFII